MDSETLTRDRAYSLWQQAGCPDGRSEEFWFAAVAEVAAERPEAAAPTLTKPGARRRAGAATGARSTGTKVSTAINTPMAAGTILPA